MDVRVAEVLDFIGLKQECSSSEIQSGIAPPISQATIKRLLSRLIEDGLIEVKGQGRATRYSISPAYEVLRPIDMDKYFAQEIDERPIRDQFNPQLVARTLRSCSVFNAKELERLEALQAKFKANVAQLSEMVYRKELERLVIDLSWKSSQIEGNTYSLLETEILLREKHTASGKTKEEAVMLLNHKEAIDFIIAHPDYLFPLTVARIEDIHSMLTKELAIGRNIRNRRVGISGTNYRPLDNAFQITEALMDMCTLVNGKENVFEKALLVLMLISYIQPFEDGNKRTARIAGNAMLLENGHCPISFRTVDSVEYKKAMLIFYEQNNISCFKKIFLDQFEFAVSTYF